MSAKKVLTAATMSACLAGGLLTIAVPAASAKDVTAGCVNKKTNEMKVLLKSSKKCKKGWKKITFNTPGATGAPGAAGATGPVSVRTVKDATGAVVGQSLYDAWTGSQGVALVLVDGGAYNYNLANGKVSPEWDEVYYTDATCSPAGAVTPVYNTGRYLAGLNSFGRVIDRPNFDQAPRAYKGTAGIRAVVSSDSFYYRDYAGGCNSTFPWMETIAVLQPVTAPPDRPGPLSFG